MNVQIFKPHVFNELGKLDHLYGDVEHAGSWFLNGVESMTFPIACALVIAFNHKRKWAMTELVEWLDGQCEGRQEMIARSRNGTGVFVVFFEREIDAIKFYMTHGDKL
jgi:hypothetical protein